MTVKSTQLVSEEMRQRKMLLDQMLALQAEVNALREDRAALIAIQDDYEGVIEDLHIHQEELKAQNEALEQSQQDIIRLQNNYHELFEHAPIGYVIINQDIEIQEINKLGISILNRKLNNLCFRPMDFCIEKQDREIFRQHIRAAFQHPDEVQRIQVQVRNTEPKRIILIESLFISNQAHRSCRCTLTDISDILNLQEDLLLNQRILEEMHEGVMIANPQGKIVFVNRAFSEVTGYSKQEAMGQSPSLLSSAQHDARFYREMWHRINESGLWRGEIWNKRKTGEVYPEWLSISALTNSQNQIDYYLAIFSDISDRKSSELKLRQLAHHDVLTDLPNRLYFIENLRQYIANGYRQKSCFAVLFIDLDKFKKVNDTFGHLEGDLVLKEASERMLSCIRETDTLARLGGDEFAIIMAPPVTEEGSLVMAQRIVDACREPFVFKEHRHYIGASVGIAHFPEDGRDTETLLRHADLAMYQVKASGRGHIQRYQKDSEQVALERTRLEVLLRYAIDKNQVELFYQPQIFTTTELLLGFECLVRIRDETQQFVAPSLFIPIAEETGLIIPLSEIIIDLALSQQQAWQEVCCGKLPKLSINLSVQHLKQQNFTTYFLERVAYWQVDPATIAVEVTESEAILNYNEIFEPLEILRSRGIKVAIDDFGTGYSSLAHLKSLPIDILKIDKIFIDDVPGDIGAENLVKSILSLAKGRDLVVIAEGVEEDKQLAWLRGQYCDAVQGYIFSKPLDKQVATNWLKTHYACC